MCTVHRSLAGSKFCGDAPCGFSDAKTSSKDAEEYSTSMRKTFDGSCAFICNITVPSEDIRMGFAAPCQTYSFFRIEILGALVSIQMIWLLAGILVLAGHDGHSHGHGHGHGEDYNGLEAGHHQHHHHEDNSKYSNVHHHTHEADHTQPLLSTCSEDEPKWKQKKQQKSMFRGLIFMY
ncbi:Metal tolerance protein 1 [Melia azedarach]|uniref:Metal tolerance protein 1 n=1 Tax=Melia azedarach TaxID=155640 RepID=A0ACC1YJH0_MELAZ|nr:Metal tolerance protein 1 [Melia azedarach]